MKKLLKIKQSRLKNDRLNLLDYAKDKNKWIDEDKSQFEYDKFFI